MAGIVDGAMLGLRLRLRPDIQWSRYSLRPPLTWVATDPVSMSYYYFSDMERQVACRLDGRRTLAESRPEELQSQISDAWLSGLLARLDQACLLVPTVPVQHGQRLWARRVRESRRSYLTWLLGPLQIRIPLLDPTRLLDWLAPLGRCIFNRMWLFVWSILAIVVACWISMRVIAAPGSLLESFEQITMLRVIGLVAIFGMVKSCHELGHALACRYHRAECHEIGLMFLVFMPCLYCDTTDSWKLPSRWRRAGIAAAGIYIELCFAMLAAVLWLVTLETSPVHYWAANVMMICTISSFLVNANPFMRYDGYYVLSDLWGVPNLHTHSQEAARRTSVAWLTGTPHHRERWDANPYALAAFASLGVIYRHVVVCLIAWLVWRLLDGVGLSLVGVVVLVMTFTSLLLADLYGIIRLIKDLLIVGKLRFIRGLLALGAGCGLYAALVHIPWPTRVSSRAVTSLAQVSPVYAQRTGQLMESVEPGASVKKDDIVARLESPELEMDILTAHGDVQLLRRQILHLRLGSIEDDKLASELANKLEELAKVEGRLALLQQEVSKLDLAAPHEGRVLSADHYPVGTLSEATDFAHALPLLSPINHGQVVERGQLLGWVAEGHQTEVLAYVIEQDAEILSPGMNVSCRWDSAPSDLYPATVRRVAPEPIDEMPEPLRGDQSIPYRQGREGRILPAQPYYEVLVEVTRCPRQVAHQSVLTVQFHTAPRTLMQSFRRWFDRHIRPEL